MKTQDILNDIEPMNFARAFGYVQGNVNKEEIMDALWKKFMDEYSTTIPVVVRNQD